MATCLDAPDHLLRLGHAFQEAKVLLSAVELDVFTVLGTRSLDAEALRMRINIAARGARDFFDTLVALGLLCRDERGRYANTEQASLYLDRHGPSYLGGELAFLNTQLFAHWNSLTPALKTGKHQSVASSEGNYPHRYTNSNRLREFVEAMTAGTLFAAQTLAEKFAWKDYRTVMDVGAAEGCLPVQIAQAHEHITGGGFDLPAVEPLFDRYVQRHRLAARLRFLPGDFFRDPLPQAEVLVMGRVLHNWDLPTKMTLLEKAYDALPAGGALIVYERFIDDDRRVATAGLLSSLNMLIMTAGGFDSTVAECSGWMRDVGFRKMEIQPLTQTQTMVVGIK